MCEDGIISITYISVQCSQVHVGILGLFRGITFSREICRAMGGCMNLQRCVAEYLRSAMREDVVPMLPALCFREALSAASLCTVALF